MFCGPFLLFHPQRDSRDRSSHDREEKLISEHRLALDRLTQRHAEQEASLESQHKSLWIAREHSWATEQEARENLLADKIKGWEETYKAELQKREQKLQSLSHELRTTRDRKESLERELDTMQKQLRDTVGILEDQTAKISRVGHQIRINDIENS